MWTVGWRDQAWEQLAQRWDLIVIGGGITGAGILREAVRAGLRAVLFEAGDFASGTSSRSSKLVHGGLRYLRDAKLRLTMVSVRERQQLLKQGRGLVTPLGFLLANFKGDRVPAWLFGAGLVLYDLMGLQWGHRHYDAKDMRNLCPPLSPEGLLGGFRYFDAQTDDARLVLRLIREAVREGGLALNYARAESLLRDRTGRVRGVALQDLAPEGKGRSAEVEGAIVVNATGAWADELRGQVGARPRIRRLRGSHLVFPWHRLPLTRAITFLHPLDARPVFAFPWEGVTLFGTTDVDSDAPLSCEPRISGSELDYLLDGLAHAFPEVGLSEQDLQATYAGVRAVIGTGKADPSKESREHVLWREKGLLTVTGGKLTTFRVMARDALRLVRAQFERPLNLKATQRVFDPPPENLWLPASLDREVHLRLLGRYAQDLPGLVDLAIEGDWESIGGSPCRWAELRWAAHAEGVVHLEDLLLRRVRLALTAPAGGLALLDRIRPIVQDQLGWDDTRWQTEANRYATTWRKSYAPPHLQSGRRQEVANGSVQDQPNTGASRAQR